MQYLKKEIRSKIIASAISEFKANGFNNASIRIIAQNAGISLGNIYRYYTNKEDLFIAVVNPLLTEAKEVAERFKQGNSIIAISIVDIVDLLNKFTDEYSIIKKSKTVHYKNFFDILADGVGMCVSNFLKTKENCTIKNPEFPYMTGRAYISCLLELVHEEKNEHFGAYAQELTDFFFKDIENRF